MCSLLLWHRFSSLPLHLVAGSFSAPILPDQSLLSYLCPPGPNPGIDSVHTLQWVSQSQVKKARLHGELHQVQSLAGRQGMSLDAPWARLARTCMCPESVPLRTSHIESPPWGTHTLGHSRPWICSTVGILSGAMTSGGWKSAEHGFRVCFPDLVDQGHSKNNSDLS